VPNNNTKIVFVVRKELNMRKGKMIAQGGHAANLALFNPEGSKLSFKDNKIIIDYNNCKRNNFEKIKSYLDDRITKIVTYTKSLEEFNEVKLKAENAGLEVSVVTDAGCTEFNGVPTITIMAIGPDYFDKFEGITSHLPLL